MNNDTDTDNGNTDNNSSMNNSNNNSSMDLKPGEKKKTKGKWTPEEDEILIKAVQLHNQKNWKKIADHFPDRTDVQCHHRYQKVLHPNLVKGAWTKEEDEKVIALVKQYGPKKWSDIALHLKGRMGKQCRERWHNHLNPNIKKEAWTEEEDQIIREQHAIHGNKWAEIAKHLPGRTDNAIKNHWNSSMKRSTLALANSAQQSENKTNNTTTTTTPITTSTLKPSSSKSKTSKPSKETNNNSIDNNNKKDSKKRNFKELENNNLNNHRNAINLIESNDNTDHINNNNDNDNNNNSDSEDEDDDGIIINNNKNKNSNIAATTTTTTTTTTTNTNINMNINKTPMKLDLHPTISCSTNNINNNNKTPLLPISSSATNILNNHHNTPHHDKKQNNELMSKIVTPIKFFSNGSTLPNSASKNKRIRTNEFSPNKNNDFPEFNTNFPDVFFSPIQKNKDSFLDSSGYSPLKSPSFNILQTPSKHHYDYLNFTPSKLIPSFSPSKNSLSPFKIDNPLPPPSTTATTITTAGTTSPIPLHQQLHQHYLNESPYKQHLQQSPSTATTTSTASSNISFSKNKILGFQLSDKGIDKNSLSTINAKLNNQQSISTPTRLNNNNFNNNINNNYNNVPYSNTTSPSLSSSTIATTTPITTNNLTPGKTKFKNRSSLSTPTASIITSPKSYSYPMEFENENVQYSPYRDLFNNSNNTTTYSSHQCPQTTITNTYNSICITNLESNNSLDEKNNIDMRINDNNNESSGDSSVFNDDSNTSIGKVPQMDSSFVALKLLKENPNKSLFVKARRILGLSSDSSSTSLSTSSFNPSTLSSSNSSPSSASPPILSSSLLSSNSSNSSNTTTSFPSSSSSSSSAVPTSISTLTSAITSTLNSTPKYNHSYQNSSIFSTPSFSQVPSDNNDNSNSFLTQTPFQSFMNNQKLQQQQNNKILSSPSTTSTNSTNDSNKEQKKPISFHLMENSKTMIV